MDHSNCTLTCPTLHPPTTHNPRKCLASQSGVGKKGGTTKSENPKFALSRMPPGDRTWAPSASRGPFPSGSLGSSPRAWLTATLTRRRRTLWRPKFQRSVPRAAGTQRHSSPGWAGAGGPDPTRQERIAIAGVKSERISAKPETKAALGGPRRAPSPGSPRPRRSSPRRELPKRLSSTPRFARGAAPGRVRSWCPRRAAHWDPPGMSGAQGGHWRAGRDNSPAPLAPAASTHPERRLQGEPAAREWRPSTTTNPSREPRLRCGPTRQRHLLLGLLGLVLVPSPAPGQGRRRLGRRAQEGADSR